MCEPDTANDPFITIDTLGRIIDWNRQAETVFGWAREDALGRTVAETIIPDRYRAAHDGGLREFLATAEPAEPAGFPGPAARELNQVPN